jgi:hypothetical protein
MPKNIEDILEENKDFLKPNPEWDSKNRRSPNILIGRLIQFTANKYPSLRLSQIFAWYGLDMNNIQHSTESKEIWDTIQKSKVYQDNISEFLDYLDK